MLFSNTQQKPFLVIIVLEHIHEWGTQENDTFNEEGKQLSSDTIFNTFLPTLLLCL